MVATRRSGRGNANLDETKGQKEDESGGPEGPDEDTNDITSVSKASPRALRRRRRETQRTRNLGVGLKINNKAKGTHLTFNNDDDEGGGSSGEPSATLDEGEMQDVASTQEANSANLDDDDAVEEMGGGFAREQAMQQRAHERKTAQLQKLENKKMKKRKRKVPPATAAVATDKPESPRDFDDTFFDQVDADISTQRKEKRKGKVEPKGKHTTFVANDDVTSQPITKSHNISLVVLGSGRHSADGLGTKPSAAAHFFSRSRLTGGNSKVKGKKKKSVKDGWTRSKKMNRRLFVDSKQRRRTSAASHFVVKP